MPPENHTFRPIIWFFHSLVSRLDPSSSAMNITLSDFKTLAEICAIALGGLWAIYGCVVL